MSVTIRVRRTCWACEHFRCDFGHRGWGPQTPGEPPELACSKGHFGEFRDEDEMTRQVEPLNLRKAAEKCGDFTINREVVT